MTGRQLKNGPFVLSSNFFPLFPCPAGWWDKNMYYWNSPYPRCPSSSWRASSPPDTTSAAFMSCLCNIKLGFAPGRGDEISWISWRNKDFRGWWITSHCTVKLTLVSKLKCYLFLEQAQFSLIQRQTWRALWDENTQRGKKEETENPYNLRHEFALKVVFADFLFWWNWINSAWVHT